MLCSIGARLWGRTESLQVGVMAVAPLDIILVVPGGACALLQETFDRSFKKPVRGGGECLIHKKQERPSRG